MEKGRWKIEMEGGKVPKLRRGPFLFCFVLFGFVLFLFFTFQNDENLFWGYQKMEIFYREKAFHVGKKIWKNDFAPSEKVFCYAPEGEHYVMPKIHGFSQLFWQFSSQV